MFNLESAIAEWRRQMQAAGVKTPVPLDELEAHLRDDFAQSIRSGLDPEAAFAIAATQVGEGVRIQQEFKKLAIIQRRDMRQIVVILLALFGMLFGMAMVLPQLGLWYRTGVLRSSIFLVLGTVLVAGGGMLVMQGIKRSLQARGRKVIGLVLIAAALFNSMPLILSFFQTRQSDATEWAFCILLAAVSLSFFGSCWYLNQRGGIRDAV